MDKSKYTSNRTIERCQEPFEITIEKQLFSAFLKNNFPQHIEKLLEKIC